MTVNSSMEVRFVELMSRIFQLDEAERLDFGIYQIIRRHNRKFRGFLGEVVSEGGNKVLRGKTIRNTETERCGYGSRTLSAD